MISVSTPSCPENRTSDDHDAEDRAAHAPDDRLDDLPLGDRSQQPLEGRGECQEGEAGDGAHDRDRAATTRVARVERVVGQAQVEVVVGRPEVLVDVQPGDGRRDAGRPLGSSRPLRASAASVEPGSSTRAAAPAVPKSAPSAPLMPMNAMSEPSVVLASITRAIQLPTPPRIAVSAASGPSAAPKPERDDRQHHRLPEVVVVELAVLLVLARESSIVSGYSPRRWRAMPSSTAPTSTTGMMKYRLRAVDAELVGEVGPDEVLARLEQADERHRDDAADHSQGGGDEDRPQEPCPPVAEHRRLGTWPLLLVALQAPEPSAGRGGQRSLSTGRGRRPAP